MDDRTKIAKQLVAYKRTHTDDQFDAFLHGMRVGYSPLQGRSRDTSDGEERRRKQRTLYYSSSSPSYSFEAPQSPETSDFFNLQFPWIGAGLASKASRATAKPHHSKHFEDGKPVGHECTDIAEHENNISYDDASPSTGETVAFSVFSIYDQLLSEHSHWRTNFPRLDLPVDSPLNILFVSDVNLFEPVTKEEQDIYFSNDSERLFTSLDIRTPPKDTSQRALLLLTNEFGSNIYRTPFGRFLSEDATRIGSYGLDEEHTGELSTLLDLVREPSVDFHKIVKLGQRSSLPLLSHYKETLEGPAEWLARKLLYVIRLRKLFTFQRDDQDAYMFLLLLPFVLHVCQRLAFVHTATLDVNSRLSSEEAIRYLRHYNDECISVFLERRLHSHLLGFHEPSVDEHTLLGFNALILDEDEPLETAFVAASKHVTLGKTVEVDEVHASKEEFLEMTKHLGVNDYLEFNLSQTCTWLFEPKLRNHARTQVSDLCTIITMMSEAERRVKLLDIMSASPHGRIPRYMFVGFISKEQPKSVLNYTTHVLQHYDHKMEIYIPEEPSTPYYLSSAHIVQTSFDTDPVFGNLSYSGNAPDIFSDDNNTSSSSSSSQLHEYIPPAEEDIFDMSFFDNTGFVGSRLSSSTREQSRTVLRKASYLDMRPRPDEKYAAYEHVVASEGTAIGEHVGHAVYVKDTGETKLLKYDGPRTRTLLEDFVLASSDKSDIKGFTGERLDLISASTTLNVDLVIDYKSNLSLSGKTKDRPYRMFVYLSQSFQVSEPFIFDTSEARGPQKVSLSLKVRQSTIPEHTNINFDSYSLYTNDDGIVGVNQSGFASVRLALLVKSKRGRSLELRVPTSILKKVKGRVNVQCKAVSLPFDVPDVKESDILAEQRKTVSIISAYIQENKSFYKKYPPVFSVLQYVTVFQYHCRTGVIPGSLFDMFRLPRSNEEFYVNIMRVSIQRLFPGVDISDVYSTWSTMEEPLKLRAAMAAVTIYASTCTYSQDAIDNNVAGKKWSRSNIELIDSFDTLRHTQTADCEDKDQEILQEVAEIKYNRKDFQSALMREVRKLFKRFIFFSTLCCVSKGSISFSDIAENKSGSLVAHECAIAIPNYTFFEALKRSDPEHTLLSAYSERTRGLGRNDRIYILEGTGNLDPLPREEDPQRKAVEKKVKKFSSGATSLLFEQYFYTASATSNDSFYKLFVNLMTPEFFVHRGLPCVEFLLVGKHNKRGVFFSDLLDIDKHLDVKIVETPRIPLITFNKSMRLVDDNFPQISLQPCSQELDITDEMRTIVRRLTCVNAPNRSEVPAHEHCDIMQCRFELMTERRITTLLRDAKSNDLNILCRIEALSRNFIDGKLFGCYTLIFY